ncbi:MAG: tetratricopeptide repeat protein [Chthoniobacterales bacterium]|nr:tetratricopeptide repeat protein [Chthoniobacterales bacterium]
MPSFSQKKKPPRAGNPPSSPPPPQNERNLTFKVLIILLSGLLIYAPVFHGGWLWDDDQEITANALLPDPAGLSKIWTGKSGADYFPLKATAQWLFFRVNSANPTGWHLLNISLHLLNALLIWKLFARLKVPEAWLGGLIFCIHPILIESVAWVSELKNTLSLPFLIFSMLAWINFEEKRRRADYVLAVLFFIAAILTKTSVVMYPFVLLLYAWWKRGKISMQDLVRSTPFFLVSLLMGLLTIHFQFGRAIGYETIPVANLLSVSGFLSRLATAGMAILFYLWKCVLPFGLLPIYPRWEVDPPSWWQFLPWPILLGLFLWLWSKRATWGRHALFGIGFFVINLFPILGFITMSYMRITWVADHFVYLPVIGIIGLLTAAAGTAYNTMEEEDRQWLFRGGVVFFALFVMWSHRYAGIFANEHAMWTHTLKYNPNAWQAHSRLGKVMLEMGNADAAFYHISESVRLRPDLAETHNNYGAMLEKKGDTEGAVEQLRIAIRLAPDITIYKVNLSSLLIRTGKYEEGAKLCKILLEGDPDEPVFKGDPNNPTFLCNYGVALFFLGRNEEAIDSFERALKINPNLKDAKENLATALKKRVGGGTEAAPNPPATSPNNGILNAPQLKLFGN